MHNNGDLHLDRNQRAERACSGCGEPYFLSQLEPLSELETIITPDGIEHHQTPNGDLMLCEQCRSDESR